jgi:hypothetical protein
MENSTYCVQEVARSSFGISMFFLIFLYNIIIFKIWFMTNSLNCHILGVAYFFLFSPDWVVTWPVVAVTCLARDMAGRLGDFYEVT